MKHPWGCKKHHWLIILDRLGFKFVNVLKVKHVLLYESFLDLLIRPIDKELVVKVSFCRQSSTEEYRVL
jgi:hypothetical protein